MSLMMDDNLAGSGNTITEVASVSRRRRRGPRSIALRSAKPTLQASDKPSIPSLGTGPRVPLVSLFRPLGGPRFGPGAKLFAPTARDVPAPEKTVPGAPSSAAPADP